MTGPRSERPAPRPRQRLIQPGPPRLLAFSQQDNRERWFKGLGCGHFLSFDPRIEVSEVCGPLASEITGLFADGVRMADRRNFGDDRCPVEPLRDVQAIASSVRDLRRDLVEALVRVRAGAPEGMRDRLAALVRDRDYERAPEIAESDLVSGAWVDVLVAYVSPVSDDVVAVVKAQPADRVSVLDLPITDALSTASEFRLGLWQRVRRLQSRFPELQRRRVMLLQGRAARSEVDLAAQQRTDETLRRLGLS